MRRIWYFSGEGKHKPADEELRIYRGRDERLVGCPISEEEDEWRRAFIARELLPNNLANFFLFDGEQVQVLAERDMSAQVRTGIEGLLGIQILRELENDLDKYATAKRSQVQGGSSTKELQRIRNDVLVLESQNEHVQASLNDVRSELERLTTRRDVITRELGSLGAGSGETTVRERFEELNRVRRTIEELLEKLQARVTDDLSLALTGERLRRQTSARLDGEEARESWEAGKRQGEDGLDRFVASMSTSFAQVSPRLTESQEETLIDAIEINWRGLWHPAPLNCAPDIRHAYAQGADRARTKAVLERVDRVSVADLSTLLEEKALADRSRDKLENEIAQLEGISHQVEMKAHELKALNSDIDKLQADRGRLERELETLSKDLGQRRGELTRYVEAIDRAGPSVRRARWADTVRGVLQRIVEAAVPDQIGAVAEAMTRAFTSMSHKNIVKKVEILPDCTVQLLSASGRDIRDLALSAGEQQIFAQALIAAIAEISQRDFPIVVDTPLGRLDDLHREGVLNHFTSRDGQVILLSTDTEVTGRYLELLKPRLSAAYHITHDSAIGKSTIGRGYFPGMGV